MRADAEGERVTAEWLRRGGVAVVPTDTVYGLAARPAEADAVRAIYRMKGRPEGMHLPVLAASVDQVRALGVAFTPGAEALARTLVARSAHAGLRLRAAARPARLAAGRAEVAVRIPAHDFLRAVLQQTGVLVVTSANPHGAPDAADRRRRGRRSGLRGRSWSSMAASCSDVPSTLVNVNGPGAVRGARGRHPAARHRRRAAGAPVSRTLLAIETSCDETAAAVVDEALVGALVRGRQPDRPARRLRRGRARSWPAAPTSRR